MHKKVLNFLLFLLSLLVITSYACRKNMPQTITYTTDTSSHVINGNTNMPHDSSGYSYLALGDSYTIGESVKEDERYPAQTVRLFEAETGKKISWLKYIAKTGWTTSNLFNAINDENLNDTFDIVTLLIGVNDQYQQEDTTGYRDKFTLVLKQAIRMAGDKKSHVFVLSVPDYSVTPFGSQMNPQMISTQIDMFNNINRQVSNSYSITYVDITGISREALNDSSLIAYDGLHPSGKMYAKWAALLKDVIKRTLK